MLSLNTCAEETQSVSEETFAEGEPEGRASGREKAETGKHGVLMKDTRLFLCARSYENKSQ